jgi:hypothetical protein
MTPPLLDQSTTREVTKKGMILTTYPLAPHTVNQYSRYRERNLRSNLEHCKGGIEPESKAEGKGS